MISVCKDISNTVYLTDRDYENAYEVNKVLSLIIRSEEQNHGACTSLLRFIQGRKVILFAQKYEMKWVIATITLTLHGLVSRYPPEGGEHFLDAAFLGEWNLCGRLIGVLDHQEKLDHDDMLDIREMLDWRYWTLDSMNAIGKVDSKFVWAVCQAGTKQVGGGKTEEIQYEELGEDVAKLMTV